MLTKISYCSQKIARGITKHRGGTKLPLRTLAICFFSLALVFVIDNTLMFMLWRAGGAYKRIGVPFAQALLTLALCAITFVWARAMPWTSVQNKGYKLICEATLVVAIPLTASVAVAWYLAQSQLAVATTCATAAVSDVMFVLFGLAAIAIREEFIFRLIPFSVAPKNVSSRCIMVLLTAVAYCVLHASARQSVTVACLLFASGIYFGIIVIFFKYGFLTTCVAHFVWDTLIVMTQQGKGGLRLFCLGVAPDALLITWLFVATTTLHLVFLFYKSRGLRLT